jgi:hypothetical protein
LSRKLEEAGRAIRELGLRRIEDEDGRDVDDLMALAGALDVSPITLLMPGNGKAKRSCGSDWTPAGERRERLGLVAGDAFTLVSPAGDRGHPVLAVG